MREIFPSIFLLRPDKPGPRAQFPYLVRREQGNILFTTKSDLSPFTADIRRLGGIDTVLVGDRHHVVAHTVAMAKQWGAPLIASDIEAKVLHKAGIEVTERLPTKRQTFASDLEIIPTPGHTRGAFSYLWSSPQGTTYFFVGDALVPVDGTWQYYLSRPQYKVMLQTVELIATLEFDVILSNSFAATPQAWVEVDTKARKALVSGLLKRLKLGP